MSISLPAASIETLAEASIDDLASSTLGDSTPVEHTPEYSRLVTYQASVTTGDPYTIGGNVRLFIYLDEHMKQHTLSSGWDVHFQTPDGVELNFELVAYQNGVGVWWVALKDNCYIMNALGQVSSYSFYMLYGDSSRNYDRSTKQIWWGNVIESSAGLNPRILSRSINYGIVLHATYANTSSNDPDLGYFQPYTEASTSYLNSILRPLNSAFFDGLPQGKPMKLKVPDYPPTTPPIHLGQVTAAHDESVPYNVYGLMHLYSAYRTPQDADPYYYPDLGEPSTITGDVGLMVGVSAHQGTRCLTDPRIPDASPWYEPVCIASLHGLNIIVQGNYYYMKVDDFNYPSSVVQTTYIGSNLDMNNEEFYYPLLIYLSKKYCRSEVGDEYTLYEAWAVQPDTIINLGSYTTPGHQSTSVAPGISVKNSNITFETQPEGTNKYNTECTVYEVIAGTYADFTNYPSSDMGRARAINLWYMMFQNQSIRTISEPVYVSGDDSPTSTPLFIWNKPRIYQGLAGGCN